MRFFKKSPEQLEEELVTLKIEKEVSTQKAEIAEREAVIKELQSRYGSKWTKILGVSKLANLSTLRSFLQSAKGGMTKTYIMHNSKLDPSNLGGIRKV